MSSTKRPTTRTSPRRPSAGGDDAQPQTITVSKTPPASTEPKLQLERLGDMLKRIREERGDDLQQIADYLCIRRNFLVALENSKYDEFPADAYVIGFLRSYANLLGIDGKEAIDRYRNEMAGRRKKPALLLPTPISEGRAPSALIMAGAGVAALLVYILWYGISSSDRAAVTTPPPLPTTVATIDSASTGANAITTSTITPPLPIDSGSPAPIASVPAASPTPSMPETTTQQTSTGESFNATAKDSHLSIRATESTWVLVTDGHGNTVFDHVLKPGDTYKVPADTSGLLLTSGNGNGIVLTLDGVDLPRLTSGTSRVVRNISLEPSHLKALPRNPND